MTGQPDRLDEAQVKQKWQEIAPLIDRMMARVGTTGEFPVQAGSSLRGDDKASDPYQVSHVVRMCLTAGVDHLHAAKVLVVDQRVIHLAVPASLARGALENLATAYWILGPMRRTERIGRALRWYAKNFKDQETAVAPLNLPNHRSLESTLEKVDAVAQRHGLEAKAIRRGYTSTDAVGFAETSAPNLGLGVVFPWRLCSGFAHGRPWAYLASGAWLNGA